MPHPLRLTFLAVALALTACAPADPQTRTSAALASQVFKPAYATWAMNSQQLAGSAAALCGGSMDLPAARNILLDTQTAWAALQPLQLGLITEGNRSWQVQFWPDKKNLVARQIEALLERKPAPGLSDLEQASVVVQGLTAYEYLLFDPAIDLARSADRERYCALLQGIAQHQQRLADEVLADWQASNGIASQLEHFPNARYADAHAAIADLLRTQVTGLAVMKKKLGTALGTQNKGTAQPFQAEAWRSDGSLDNLAAGLNSARLVWTGQPDNGLRSLLRGDQQALAGQLDQAYATSEKNLAGLDKSLTGLLAQASGRSQLDELYSSLDQLQRLHERELAKALDVQLGFNAHDGD